ncbi:hypothetical protein BYT27DRAFT_7251275 [Phlegmacium glaucopus]|nr:hypothetical protein BYT27DRAFT_7251275 [Phlegmacium glaucopus]
MLLRPRQIQKVRQNLSFSFHTLSTDLAKSLLSDMRPSTSTDSSYLAYPSPVPSPMSLATAANGSPSTAVASSSTSAWRRPPFLHPSLLATSSDKGTVIRVWSIPGAEKLYQFTQGTREARIYLMDFNLVLSLATEKSPSSTATATTAPTAHETTAACDAFCQFIEIADLQSIKKFLTTAASFPENENLEILWDRAYDEGYHEG